MPIPFCFGTPCDLGRAQKIQVGIPYGDGLTLDEAVTTEAETGLVIVVAPVVVVDHPGRTAQAARAVYEAAVTVQFAVPEPADPAMARLARSGCTAFDP